MQNSITAVVPVRLESSRLEKKVLQNICINSRKITLFENKLEQLSGVFDNIIVSCGDDELIDIAKQYNCTISYRSKKFIETHYKVSTEDSIREVVKDVKSKYVAWAPVVVPFHDDKIFLNAIKQFEQALSNGYDSLMTVTKDMGYYWFQSEPLNYFPDKRHVQSQDLEPLLKVTNGLYISSLTSIQDRGYFLGKKPYKLSVPWYAGIDIDTQEDLILANTVGRHIEDFIT